MSDRYRVYTNTTLLTGWLNEDTWIEDFNKLIDDGWIHIGGVVHFGNHGLMQTMYKPEVSAEEDL